MSKNWMKFLIVSPLLLLTACGTGENTNYNHLNEAHVVLKDGRTITCIIYKAGYAGGLSCDWSK